MIDSKKLTAPRLNTKLPAFLNTRVTAISWILLLSFASYLNWLKSCAMIVLWRNSRENLEALSEAPNARLYERFCFGLSSFQYETNDFWSFLELSSGEG